MSCLNHVWVDYFWTADKFPNAEQAQQGFVYWQRCRDCDEWRNPEPIVLGESAEPLTTPNADILDCFLCGPGSVAVASSAAVGGLLISRYPLCGDHLEREARDRRRGRRTNHG